jgi:class 3 adenylate cyclase
MLMKTREEPSGINIASVEVPDESDDYIEYSESSLNEVDIIRTFSPLIVHRKIDKNKMDLSLQPSCQIHYGSVLFADISGFTRLANSLSVDQLQYHISNYFTMLFDCVEKFGGDILKICGDAIMIMWPLEHDSKGSRRQDQAACALTASLCGRELLLSCGSYHAYHGDVKIDLSLHCGVGTGDVPCFWVGKSSRWEFLITGETLHQISSTEPEAKSGEIVVSPQVYELVKNDLEATLTAKGNYLLTSKLLVRNKETEKFDEKYSGHLIKLSEISYVSDDGYDEIPDGDNIKELEQVKELEISENLISLRSVSGCISFHVLSNHPTLQFEKNREIANRYLGTYAMNNLVNLTQLASSQNVRRGLQSYVHESARPRLRHIESEFLMAELREVVTLFVNITGLDEDFRMKRVEVIQDVMAAIIDRLGLWLGLGLINILNLALTLTLTLLLIII